MPSDTPPSLLSWLHLHLSNEALALPTLGILLAAGVLGAEIVRRLFRLPLLTGYMLTGVAIGPIGLNLLTQTGLSDFRFLVDAALALVLFQLGQRIDIDWLLREKRLLATGLVTSALTFATLYGFLVSTGADGVLAGMVAAIGITSSPPIALLLVRELKAEGQVTERMLHLTALSNALAFVLFAVCSTALHLQNKAGWVHALLEPGYRVLGGAMAGWLTGQLLGFGSAALATRTQRGTLAIAAVALLAGLGYVLGYSTLIALLVLGVCSRREEVGQTLDEGELAPVNAILCVVLFVYTGAQLRFSQLADSAPLVAGFIGLRTLAMAACATALARLNGISWRKGLWLGLSLLPVSGVATALALQTGDYASFGEKLTALLISVFALLELAGPLVLRLALTASGEARKQ